jgi:Holliday junction resolvasome RuvABC endonuclease subunit
VVLGVHVHTADARYLAHFAVVDGDTVVATSTFRAPSSESEGGQLHELSVRVAQLLDSHSPDVVAIRQTEQGKTRRPMAQLAVPLKAEGAILAAAGGQGVESESIAGATLRSKLPNAKGSTEDAVNHLCQRLRGGPIESGCHVATAVAKLVASRLA